MKHYYNFRKHAQIIYKVAIKYHGHSDDFSSVLNGRTYICHSLQGVLDGFVLAGVCSIDEVIACRKYAAIVEKAYDRLYVKPAIHK